MDEEEDGEDDERNGSLDHFMEKLRPTAEISCDGLTSKVSLWFSFSLSRLSVSHIYHSHSTSLSLSLGAM